MSRTRQFDVVIVGAGFSGMQMLHHVRGLGMSARVLEAAADVGGTWYWNRYPGARCDAESVEYSYQFDEELQQEWEWSERFAAQPEILRYASHVADRFDLRRDIQFGTRVTAASYDDERDTWTVATADGAEVTARYLVMASGCLSSASIPAFPGIESFGGTVCHTGRWPHDGIDISGKRVGVIGTGSSGVQVIPMLARQAGELYVFQRTATYYGAGREPPARPGRAGRDQSGLRRVPGQEQCDARSRQLPVPRESCVRFSTRPRRNVRPSSNGAGPAAGLACSAHSARS